MLYHGLFAVVQHFYINVQRKPSRRAAKIFKVCSEIMKEIVYNVI